VLPLPEEPIFEIEPNDARIAQLEADVRRASRRRKVRHATEFLIEAVIVIGLFFLFFLRVPQVDGHSMAPQIDDGDRVVIDTLAYDFRLDIPGGPALADFHLHDIQRGDVVAFALGAGDERRILLKRVIGVGGDVVSIERGVVSIDGAPDSEPYDPLRDSADLRPVRVPAGSLFVLGDNRGDSDDSRQFGPISVERVVGRAAFVAWPAQRVRAIR
jgi:signal peptidase I